MNEERRTQNEELRKRIARAQRARHHNSSFFILRSSFFIRF